MRRVAFLLLAGLLTAGRFAPAAENAALVPSRVERRAPSETEGLPDRGILVTVRAAIAAGWHLPRRLGWRQLVVAALASSSGFTLALFFATGILSTGPVLAQLTIGAIRTAAGSLLAIGAARLFHLGRFSK